VGPDLDTADRVALLRLAWAALRAAVEGGTEPPDPQGAALRMRRGAFVTLRKRGTLRGCVGHVAADRPLADVVREAAAAAALEDARFPPVAAVEVGELELEVSVLTPPRRLSPVHPTALTIGRHGLLVRLGASSGLLLPQVAVEHALDAAAFLVATCRKAGLQEDAWRHPDVEVLVFETETVIG